MRIFITTMDDPLVTNEFIKEIIRRKHREIVGLAVSKKHGQFKTRSVFKSVQYIIALAIIAGPKEMTRNFVKSAAFKLKKKLSKVFKSVENPSIVAFAQKYGIPTWEVESVQDKRFIEILKEIKPDIIINQAQEILRKRFLSIPKICVLNRHNSLLPRYRGRLAPFWVLSRGETETGVTIHTVSEEIDAGAIVAQRKIKIEPGMDYVTLTRKCYAIAPELMIEAIEKLEKGFVPEKMDMAKGEYFTTPTIMDAIRYRIMLRKRRKAM